MKCGKVDLRYQEGETTDVMTVKPALAPAYVVEKGKGLWTGTYTSAVPADILNGGADSCAVYGASGSGHAAITSTSFTRDTGTPYAVATFSVVKDG
jgi:hypothetical protein